MAHLAARQAPQQQGDTAGGLPVRIFGRWIALKRRAGLIHANHAVGDGAQHRTAGRQVRQQKLKSLRRMVADVSR